MTTHAPDAPLEALFRQTVEGATRAQAALDENLVRRGARLYSIPRVSLAAKFGVTETKGKILFVFGTGTEQRLFHEARLTLWLTPEARPSRNAAAGRISKVFLPPFVDEPGEQRRAIQDVINDLRALDARQYRKEIQKIEEALGSGADDKGVISLRLDPESGKRLIVRLGGRRDGVFRLDPSASPRLTVFSHWDSDDSVLPWAPFHELFDAFRDWQRRQLVTLEATNAEVPARLGAIPVDTIADALWDGYRAIESALGGSQAVAYSYDWRDIAAELSYTIPREAGGPEDQGTPFIRSRVLLNVVRGAETPELHVQLVSPEYALTGEARQSLLDLLKQNIGRDRRKDPDHSFWSMIEPGYETTYRAALEDSGRQREAVVLLSYRGNPPHNEFLIVWTGALDGEEREFAFTFKFEKEELVEPAMVLPLEDRLNPGSFIPTGDQPFANARVSYSKDHPGLHNFFHAVRIWDLAGGWIGRLD
jgi:hypothetical protein